MLLCPANKVLKVTKNVGTKNREILSTKKFEQLHFIVKDKVYVGTDLGRKNDAGPTEVDLNSSKVSPNSITTANIFLNLERAAV